MDQYIVAIKTNEGRQTDSSQLSQVWQNVQQAVRAAGGTLQTGDCGPYAVLGSPTVDFFAIAQFPNPAAATHASLAIQQQGWGRVTTNHILPDDEFGQVVSQLAQSSTAR